MAADSERRSLLARAVAVFRRAEAPTAYGPSGEILAATQMPIPEAPKVKKNQQTVPSHLKTATPNKDSALPRLDRQLANKDLVTLRLGASTNAVIRDLVASNADLSASVFAYLRAAVTTYTAVAKNRDGTFNRDATNLLQQLLAKFDVLGDYTDGFSGIGSIRSVSESIGREFLMYGAGSLELVLDKATLPRELAPVSVTTVQFKSDGRELRPFQKIGSDQVDLNIPTYFYDSLDQDLLEPYANSPMESAIQPTLFSWEFMNDLRRIVRKAIHPRVNVVIDSDKFLKMLPPQALHDDEQRRAFMTQFIADVTAQMNGLEPEDALVAFDTLDIGYLTAGNTNHDAEVKALSDIIDAKVATGAKAMPSTLGHGSGSQNIASIETLLFMKSAAGAVQAKLNGLYSRALTLAVRLFGFDVVVYFAFDSIDLRPDAELEAFRAMRQDRILRQLSLGMITDEEACLALTGSLPPVGMAPLSGTMFMDAKSNVDPNSTNGFTNQSTGGGDGGAGNRRPGGNPPQQKRGPAQK